MGRRYLLRKKIFCILFLLVLFGYSALNIYHSYSEWYEVIEREAPRKDNERLIHKLNSSINNTMFGRMEFIETYSYMQVLLGKKEFNNFTSIKDKKGYLHYASFFREEDPDVFEYAMRVKRLQDYAEQYGTKVIFLVTAAKYTEGVTEFALGLPVNNPNSIANELLFYLNRLKVRTVDCRKGIPSAELPYEEAFFKTDHHWTVPAAFEATKMLAGAIRQFFGDELDPDGKYLDLKNYEIVTYKQGMCGSLGRKAGGNFVGLDDFTAYWPKFDLRCTYDYLDDDEMIHLEGDIKDTVMDADVLTDVDDIYSEDQYGLYLHTIHDYDKVVNLDNPDGPTMLMIRDSYFSPVIAFMLPMFSEIEAIWSLEEVRKLDIEKYVKENRYDYIVIEVYPYNIDAEAFNYFKEVQE